jgi:hypothetical protein
MLPLPLLSEVESVLDPDGKSAWERLLGAEKIALALSQEGHRPWFSLQEPSYPVLYVAVVLLKTHSNHQDLVRSKKGSVQTPSEESSPPSYKIHEAAVLEALHEAPTSHRMAKAQVLCYSLIKMVS